MMLVIICGIVNQAIKKVQINYSKIRVHKIAPYLISKSSINSDIISFMCKNIFEENEENMNMNGDKHILNDSINSVKGSATWYLMKCYDLPEFHSQIFDTFERIANGSNMSLKITIMAELKYWLKVDIEKVFTIFIKLTNEVQPELFKYAGNVVQRLNWTHFEKLQNFYKKAYYCPSELPQIAKILCYNWIDKNEKAYPVFMSMAEKNNKVKAALVEAAVQVLKSYEEQYWEKSIIIFEMFINDDSEEIADAYERAFLFLPKSKFYELLPSINKYAVSSTKKHVSRNYYEYILVGVKKYPQNCLELIEHFDKYREPDIRQGNYYDKEVIQVLLSAYNVLFDEDAEKNRPYLVKAIAIFDRILQNDRFRSISDLVLKEVEN